MKRLLTPKLILILFILINLLIGIFIVPDYGRGIDESQVTDRAIVALRRYTFNDPGDPVVEYEALGLNQYYGTSLLMIFLFFENLLQPILHTFPNVVFHYMVFVSFMAGIYAMFVIARRLVGDWAALAATLLFATQPLFFGHAFINPKDIPGMSIFVITAAAGLWMADKLHLIAAPKNNTFQELRSHMQQDWENLSPNVNRWMRRLNWLWLAVTLIWITGFAKWGMRLLITSSYQASPGSWLGRLFARMAPNADLIPVEDYVARGVSLADTVLVPMVIALSIVAVGTNLWAIKSTRKRVWQETFAFYAHIDKPLRRKYWLPVIAAGAVWGLSISTRATNIAAGAMIGLYLLLRLREKAILPLMGYTLSTVIATILTWPYLWYFGLKGFMGAMSVFANYPYVDGRMWFHGIISHSEIPRTFMLQIIPIQFTIPLMVLALVGMGLAVVYAWRNRLPRLEIFIYFCWIFLPILYTVAAKPTLYNNFRQFFFITPPLFLFAAVTIQEIQNWISSQISRQPLRNAILVGLLIAALLPGMIEIVRLHPYQYVYYNQLVGGAEGAVGVYEMDYWAISYQEAFEYLNANAPQNAKILIRGGNDLPLVYARKDLDLAGAYQEIDTRTVREYDYVLMTTNHRHETPNTDFNALKTIYTITAGDAPLAYIKIVNP